MTKHCRSGILDRWQPAALVTSDIILLKLALGGFAIVRAADYAHGTRDSYGILEAAMPLWVWALGAFTVGRGHHQLTPWIEKEYHRG